MHKNCPLVKVSKYSNRDFLESTSPIISTSVYTCNTNLSPLKHKHALEVPLRYMRINFTVVHCSLPRLERNQLTTPTA